ncbi:hypothetical protein LCM08_12005 [Salipiger pacificus]|nr:hypothetical protein [Alloyangia pacifica]MCA0945633.1 hypothetical protein [Alloyangia pacifica]
MTRAALAAAALVAMPQAALAHDAFGDLGPFYAGLLHPVMAPLQMLLLAAVALLLARQALDSVRVAYPALVLAAAAGIVLHGVWPELAPSLRLGALLSVGLGALALWGVSLPGALLAVLAMACTAVAALSGDAPAASRDGLLAALGGILGMAAFVLVGWGVIDLLQARLGRIAGAVASAWLIAIGGMAAVLPG